jgi:hypothetical protein
MVTQSLAEKPRVAQRENHARNSVVKKNELKTPVVVYLNHCLLWENVWIRKHLKRV